MSQAICFLSFPAIPSPSQQDSPKLSLIFGHGSLNLPLSITGQRLFDDNQGMANSDHKGWSAQAMHPLLPRLLAGLILVDSGVSLTSGFYHSL